MTAPLDLPALAPVSELEKRLGVEVGSLTGTDLVRAEAALDDVSDLVRAESGRNWVLDNGVPLVPPSVKVVVLAVALRVFNNPTNYTSESAGDYSYQADPKAVGLMLTDDEVNVLHRAAALAAAEEAAASGETWSGSGSVTTPSAYGYGPDRYLGSIGEPEWWWD